MNRILKNMLLVVPLLISVSVLSTQKVGAEENTEEPVLTEDVIKIPEMEVSIFNLEDEFVVETPYYYEDDNGNVAIFDNEQEYNSFLEYKDDNSMSTYGSTYTKNTLVSTKSLSKKWIGYHSYTKDWHKASGYSLSAGKTYTASGSYNYSGVTIGLSYSRTQSATSTFSANSTKYSKLGVYADVKIKTYKTTSYDNYTGKALSSWTTRAVSYPNYYVQVVYQ